jgi:acyl-coenzyme A synthetase/AMP-(fatty) acid ligase
VCVDLSPSYLSSLFFLAALKYNIDIIPLAPNATKNERKKTIILTKPDYYLSHKKRYSFLYKIKNIEFNIEIVKSFRGKTILSDSEINKGKTVNSKIYLTTSGSTGAPKTLVICAGRLWLSGQAFIKFHSFLNNKCRFFNFYSFSYLAGLYNCLLIPIILGSSVVISESANSTFLYSFWKKVKRYNINILWLNPPLLIMLDQAVQLTKSEKKYLNTKVICAFIGMSPISLDKKRAFEKKYGFQLIENYGLSETTFISSEKINTTKTRKPFCLGSLMPDIKASICKKTKEILVKTPYLMISEIDSTRKKAQKMIKTNIWFRTGDIGKISKNKLFLNGRLKNIVKKGGFIVQVEELNCLLQKIDDKNLFICAGIDHDIMGECIVLCSLSTNKYELNEVKKYLMTNLSRYKWPLFTLQVNNIPKTLSGKICYYQLKLEITKRSNELQKF